MDAVAHPSGHQPTLPVWAGELIVQNGRQSGARRPLQVPLTVVGKAPGCDIRLNSQGIDPRHCLLVHGPDGLLIRDLDSGGGTFVNGERITVADLKDGDLLAIGAFQFRLHLPPRSFALSTANSSEEAEGAEEDAASPQDALRLQAAAVAAQQSALGEEEARLLHRKAALERQEEQLASHLEEKRRKLVLLQERAQAERASLQKDRQAYEAHLEKITGDLTQSQREVLETQERLWAERRRLAELYRRLRRRMHQQWHGERDRLRKREEELDRHARDLEMEILRLREQEQALHQAHLKFNGEYTAGRHQQRLGWQRLRGAQHAWRERRAKERQVLKQQERSLAEQQNQLVLDRQQLVQDQQAWTNRRATLERDADGLDRRIRNQRQRILQQQLEINRLDTLLRQRQEASSASTALVPIVAPPPSILPMKPAERADEKQPQRPVSSRTRGRTGRGRGSGKENSASVVPVELLAATVTGQDQDPRVRERGQDILRQIAELDRLAGDLSDQRLMLLEQLQRLVQTQHHWENDRAAVAGELEALALRMRDQEQSITQRERAYEQSEHQFRLRHRELTHLRQHLVAWRARLKMRENALEAERQQLLGEVDHREETLRKHLETVTDLRRRWAHRRRKELEKLRGDQRLHDQLIEECTRLRQDLTRRGAEIDEERRKLSERAVALEQYRQELFIRVDPATAEKRLERLRRRWQLENEASIRRAAQEREALQTELAALQTRHAELAKRQQAVTQEEQALADKTTSFEHQQALAGVRGSRLEEELHSAQSQRMLVEEQLGRMKEEIERIARQLLEEPDPPSVSLQKAA